MTDTTASFYGATPFDGRVFAYGSVGGVLRGALQSAAMGVAAVAAVGATVAVATVSGVWLVGVAMSDNPHLPARTPAGPARLALAGTAAFPPSSFEAKWALTAAAVSSVRLAAHSVAPAEERVALAPIALPHPHPKVKHEVAKAPVLPPVAKLTTPAAPVPAAPHVTPPKPAVAHIVTVPLPRARPVRPAIALAPAEKAAPQVAVAVPPPAVPATEKPAAPAEVNKKAPVLPGPESRTALYDIAGHTVYLPNGERLEAHSGLGSKRDNPGYVKVKNRGPTPPNVYDLTMRERLFHGVRAIRMNPVDGSKMFGRDGMLAHSYMLGPSGQSNGCVSFKDYHRFLRAFQKGEVDRMVVVRNLDEAPPRLASLVRAPRSKGYRYAANEAAPDSW